MSSSLLPRRRSRGEFTVRGGGDDRDYIVSERRSRFAHSPLPRRLAQNIRKQMVPVRRSLGAISGA